MPIIALVAGEPSGDRLGAAMIRDIKARRADVEFIGIGGDAMQKEGLKAIGHSDTLTLMGLDGLVTKIWHILQLRRSLLAQLRAQKPHLFIGIDAPDFNLEVERRLKNESILTGHYVAPSVWAWRQHRLAKIKAATNFILGIYPFEEKWFEQHGVNVRYVGHPILDELKALPDKKTLRAERRIGDNERVVALLIGSRKSEIKRMGKVLINTANTLIIKGYRVLIPMVNESLCDYLKTEFPQIHKDIEISIGDSRAILALADFGIIKSGTSSLEAALLDTPHIVVYKASWLSYHWVKSKMVLNDVSMPNILLNRTVVTELLQNDVTEENIYQAIDNLVENGLDQVQRQAFKLLKDEMINKRKHTAAEVVLDQLAAIENSK